MNSPKAEPISVAPAHYQSVANTLALAFAEDPVMAYIFPDAKTRLRRLAGLMHLALKTYTYNGRIDTFSDGCSAAVWQRPYPAKATLWQLLANGVEGLLKLRTCVNRANNVERAINAAKIDQPYWYLAILGTEPAHRGAWQGGQSRAGLLLRAVLDGCDQQQLPAYLESSNAANIGFYNKHGFEITEEITIDGGPSLWGMVRQPR